MLLELAISNLGVIEHASVVFGPSMTVLTGETGAGKTMLVSAIEVLLGGRADHGLVRDGADEAEVCGRFDTGSREVILRRVIPAEGRTRAYIDGRPATVGELSELGSELIALHGQHRHRLLNQVSEQRRALDRFGGIDLSRLDAARQRCQEIDAEIAEIGGDTKERAREIDLLTHQTTEISQAAIEDADEEIALDTLEDELSNAASHRETAAALVAELGADGGVLDRLRLARAGLDPEGPFKAESARLDAVLAESDDIVATIRDAAESMDDDPERLAAVRERRHLLFDLRRKYGDTLEEVIAFADQAAERLNGLIASEETSERLASERAAVNAEIGEVAKEVRAARSTAAPELAAAVQARLRSLAMERARISIEVDGIDGSDIEFRLAANSGAKPQPLAKVASGGELARTMLAMQLELNTGPDTLIFDEVDAGIGGETGLAVGAALAEVARSNQVLVITHLAQVAAFADHQIIVNKSDDGTKAVAEVALLSIQDRVGELSRMLGGDGSSSSGRKHAAELLELVNERR